MAPQQKHSSGAALLSDAASLSHDMPALVAVFLGTLTASGGGVMRDVLSGEAPSAFKKGELYITAAFVAALAYLVVTWATPAPPFVAAT
jgi:uncharacterized membrane protein YeiH